MGGFPMKRWCVVAFLVVLVAISSAAMASEPKTIPNWNTLRQDMELFKGAFEKVADMSVLNTYLPGYGVVFMGRCSFAKIEDVQRQVERILTFITPTIASLPDGEKVAVAVYSSGFPAWELMCVTAAGTSGDSATWEVYQQGR
jgi:hypothetical protein